MIRVLIFDDNKNLLEGFKLLLKDSESIFLAGAYTDADQALAMIRKDQPDVVLMDIQMPGISGIEAVRTVKSAFPNLQILMQTVFEDNDKVFAAICAGASGYILKSTPSDQVLNAIADVYLGVSLYFPESLTTIPTPVCRRTSGFSNSDAPRKRCAILHGKGSKLQDDC
jgi:DNA-binding NarL/FixJ family response regulator